MTSTHSLLPGVSASVMPCSCLWPLLVVFPPCVPFIQCDLSTTLKLKSESCKDQYHPPPTHTHHNPHRYPHHSSALLLVSRVSVLCPPHIVFSASHPPTQHKCITVLSSFVQHYTHHIIHRRHDICDCDRDGAIGCALFPCGRVRVPYSLMISRFIHDPVETSHNM
jgi:hypothetical protein